MSAGVLRADLARYNVGVRRAVDTYRTEQTRAAGFCISCAIRKVNGHHWYCGTCASRRKRGL